jgi:hypothetical protein
VRRVILCANMSAGDPGVCGSLRDKSAPRPEWLCPVRSPVSIRAHSGFVVNAIPRCIAIRARLFRPAPCPSIGLHVTQSPSSSRVHRRVHEKD